MMLRRQILAITAAAAAAIVTGCASSPPTAQELAAKRSGIDAAVDATLSRLYAQSRSAQEMSSKARGVLVFPDVKQAGFIVGGEYGEGALRVGGRTAGFYRTTSGSI